MGPYYDATMATCKSFRYNYNFPLTDIYLIMYYLFIYFYI